MKSFTDVFPTPYGVIFEGGEFVAEFPEANKDAFIQNKILNAWLECAKVHDNDYKESVTSKNNCLALIDIAQEALNMAGKTHHGSRVFVGCDPKFAKQSLQTRLDEFKKIYKDIE